MIHSSCSCSYIDLNDVCDECLPTKDDYIKERQSLEITDANGILLQNYVFGKINKKISRKTESSRKRNREIRDDVSMISEDTCFDNIDDFGFYFKEMNKNHHERNKRQIHLITLMKKKLKIIRTC